VAGFYSDVTAILNVNNSGRQSADKVHGHLGGSNKQAAAKHFIGFIMKSSKNTVG